MTVLASSSGGFSADVLRIDPQRETHRIESWIAEAVSGLKKKGVVIGLSGGIDSSVVAALCSRALGKEYILGLLMPEAESSADSMRLGRAAADSLGVQAMIEDIGPILAGAGCYQRRDDAIRSVIPEYTDLCKSKIVLPSILDGPQYRMFSVVVQMPDGAQKKARLSAGAYRGVVAATNFKQRARKMVEYYHADRLDYAVAGSANRVESDQGFFVKNGDGVADVKPIAHLYKTQVYQLAEFLGIPEQIRQRCPTTDTYSLPQSQEEFYFSIPYDQLDLCLYAKDRGLSAESVAPVIGLTTEHVAQVYRDIDAKRSATRYLHLPGMAMSYSEEIAD